MTRAKTKVCICDDENDDNDDSDDHEDNDDANTNNANLMVYIRKMTRIVHSGICCCHS